MCTIFDCDSDEYFLPRRLETRRQIVSHNAADPTKRVFLALIKDECTHRKPPLRVRACANRDRKSVEKPFRMDNTTPHRMKLFGDRHFDLSQLFYAFNNNS